MHTVLKNTVVTLDYSVTDTDGGLVDEGREALVYLHGGYDDIFPKIEEALHGKRIGESATVRLQPDEAFGEYDPELVQLETRDAFPRDLEVGMVLEGAPEGSSEEEFTLYRVTDIADDQVVLDGNHPLAGNALIFTCTVTAVRPASMEEIAHGQVHGADEGGYVCH
ncbi:MAG: peptidylprolyl isomerase [Betaproteobacteria bacterium]|nr:peptidylprolyl isomerase [Betaproteobacteria bacterium]